MTSVTLLFPGQGSQYVGMGKNFPDYLSRADNILKYPLSKLMLEGPIEELTQTQNAQPAILTHSFMIWEKLQKVLKQKNITIEGVLGHSLGEYSALLVAGALTFDDAVKAVHYRGKFMQEAVPEGVGGMTALIRVSEDWVRKACLAVSNPDAMVTPANFNEPSQIVISGNKKACQDVVKWLESNCPEKFKAMELKVSAPFHSPMMEKAAHALAQFFNQLNFKNNQYPYIANINAQMYSAGISSEIIKQNLVAQVTGSVLWTQSIQKLPPGSICLEVGPGKVLTGLVKKINPEIKIMPLDSETAFNELEVFLS